MINCPLYQVMVLVVCVMIDNVLWTNPDNNAYKESAAKKLDRASEAMRVLMSTRDFWGQCWEESTPVPASEQQPLFDHVSTVEMIIDYLEQLHPANLMNQVMAVNLSSAYFALASSAKATTKVGIVQLSLKRLRQKIEKALKIFIHYKNFGLPDWTPLGRNKVKHIIWLIKRNNTVISDY